MPRFTVLLPTHNRADVLGYAIESVLSQSETDFELFIVADGCTDETSKVVASYKDSRIHFFDLPKAPHFGYANRNIALKESRGRLIAFAAHDDLLISDHLERMGNYIEEKRLDWAYSKPVWVSTDGIIVPFCTNLMIDSELKNFLEVENTIPAACVVHTRNALENAGFWPEAVPSAADWILWRKMITAEGAKFGYLPIPTNLHFSANWKKSRFSGSYDVRLLLKMADHSDWWPKQLKYFLSYDKEQAAIWNDMATGGKNWINQFRSAINSVIDTIYWRGVREYLPGMTLLQQEIDSMKSSNTLLQQEVDSMKSSRSWRFTAFFRILKIF